MISLHGFDAGNFRKSSAWKDTRPGHVIWPGIPDYGGRMALQKGEKYRCPDPQCGCEIEVTKGAAPGMGGNLAPRCCCGKEMQKI